MGSQGCPATGHHRENQAWSEKPLVWIGKPKVLGSDQLGHDLNCFIAENRRECGRLNVLSQVLD